jgi:hypothetical protein
MKIQDLMEGYIADSLPDLINHAKSLIIMYTKTLPEIVHKYDFSVNDPYNPTELGLANRDINACKLQVGSVRSVWFTNNYLSVTKNRAGTGMQGGKSARGLKNALVTLSEIPELRKVHGLNRLAHLDVNINPNNKVQATVSQRVKGTAPKEADIQTYGELMRHLENLLPDVIKAIAKVAKPQDLESSFLNAEEVFGIGVRLENAIDRWESVKGTIPKKYEGGTSYKKQGDALVATHKNKGADLGKSDIMKPAEKPVKKHDTHSQNMSAAQDAINQGFEVLKKNGIKDHELHAIRQKVQRSDNQLMALMQVFQEFGINPNPLMEAWLKTY